MNTIENQLKHRSIREFTEEEIDDKTLKKLFEVANRTATSTGMQSFSIIRVKDENLKKEISKLCNQEYASRVKELLIFIVDNYRNLKIGEEQGKNLEKARDMDRFFQGFTDACLAAQNMVVAAESLGLGTVYFGSILNDYDRIIELLDLPELTFPVVGLGMGYPNQDPQIKPRMPMELKVFENKYKKFDSYLEKIKDYDMEMTHYYDTRAEGRRSDSFSKQVVTRYEQANEKRRKVLDSIKKQGFDLGLK